ncbi:MAG: transporter [Deltaproteobacteria bacterium]|nr:transporter [Deltaproteobacteria bacterium]
MKRSLFLFLFCLAIYPAFSFAKSSSYDALFFKPATDMGLYLGVTGADNLDQWDYTFGLMADYSQDSIKSFTAAGASIQEVVGPIFVGNLYGSVGLLPFLSVGIDFPIVPLEKFRNPTTNVRSDEFELGDLRFDLKVKLLDHYQFPVGLAFVPFVTFPTGSDTHLTGNGKFTGGGLLVIDSPRLFDRMSLALNAGYQMRNQTTVISGTTIDDQLLYGLGANLAVVRWMDLILDARGTTQANNIFKKTSQSPLEIDGALRFYFEKVKLAATVGGGAGITKGVGAPSYRILAGLSFMTPRPYGSAEYSLYQFKVPPEAVYELSQKCPYSQVEFDPKQDNPQCEEVYV